MGVRLFFLLAFEGRIGVEGQKVRLLWQIESSPFFTSLNIMLSRKKYSIELTSAAKGLPRLGVCAWPHWRSLEAAFAAARTRRRRTWPSGSGRPRPQAFTSLVVQLCQINTRTVLRSSRFGASRIRPLLLPFGCDSATRAIVRPKRRPIVRSPRIRQIRFYLAIIVLGLFE